MKKILFLLLLNSTSSWALLKTDLLGYVSKSHRPISYTKANIGLFTIADNHNGVVCSVYTPSFCLTTDSVPNANIMNIEHTWPQSLGARGIAKSDLHHLFAADSHSNSIRSSLPFCDVSIVKWQSEQSKRGISTLGDHCFEPPAKHKGNVARALFYFSVRYNMTIDNNQEAYLRLWHKNDPVDQDEMDRNMQIFKIQNNTNAFIDHPELVDQISDF